MDKIELLEALEDERQELIEMLADVPDESMILPGVSGDWSIKDILIHLTHWEGQVVTLLFQTSHGMEKPSTVHFGKEKVDQLNQRWYEAGKARAFDLVWEDWIGVRKQTIRRVSEFSDQDLNDPQRYPWLKGTPLWQWIAADSYEHEEEHADTIREWLDQQD
ncbi:MAG: ClbS/DfsB family four-helix bundle protein [Anaerolineaceae bacterium]|nr:ClbS/DfsB family four-helix bundle protein [Anaerolineaceae bacterium]